MPGPTGPSPKLLGRLAAGVLALVFVGVVWWAIARGSGPVTPAPGTTPDANEAPDITQLERGESIELTLVDKNDPTRIAGVINADRVDPLPGGEKLLTNPRAWLFPKGGGAVRVRADTGRLLMPSGEGTPESGTLEGRVRVSVFDETPAPGTPPSDGATPGVTADFDEPVRFESRYLRLTSPGAFRVRGQRVRFEGEDLTVMLNEVRQRLELLTVARGGRMELRLSDPGIGDDAGDTEPATDTPGTEPVQTADGADAQSTDNTAADTTPRAPKIDLYRTVMDSGVTGTLGTTRVDAGDLEMLTRLVDSRLPPGAIARVGFAPTTKPGTTPHATPDTTPGDDAQPSPAADPVTDAGETPAPPVAGDVRTPATDDAWDPGETLVLVWGGTMTVRPIDADADGVPDALAADDAALTLHAPQDGRVRFEDSVRGVTGDADALSYAATRAVLAMTSDAQPVNLAVDEAGVGAFASVTADLGAGEITLGGSGRGVSRTGATLAWEDLARLTLDRDRDGNLTDRLSRAWFEGRVVAEQEGGRIGSRTLDTVFAPGSDGRPALRVATIEDGSVAGTPDAAGLPRSLAGRTIRADFAGDAGSPEPVRVEATGSVHGEGDGATLDAEHAIATLARNDYGELIVRTAQAEGSVFYAGRDSTRAAGDAFVADGVRQTLRLTGPDALVAQGDSTVRGSTIDLDANARRMSVPGAGRFEQVLRDANGAETGRVLARWEESMRFDDALGKLTCLGGVSVISTPDALTRDVLSAHRVEVEMTPRPVRDPVGGRGPKKRELVLARAFGRSEGDTPEPATVETRKYDPSNPERVAGLLYLEGDQIVGDNAHATLRVPGAGTLLVLDRRGEDAEGEPDAPQRAQASPVGGDALGGSVGPGLTRFTWQGAMELRRDEGVATMDGSVLVRHKTLAGAKGDAQIAELACDTLTASFRELTGAGESATGSGRLALDSADALGSVVFRASGKELLADGARYEAAAGVVHALASPGRLVTLTEPGTAAPMSARAIRWDLVRDLVEVNRPSPVTLPQR